MERSKPPPQKRLLLVELNEFSTELLERGARDLGLANIARLLTMPATQTKTDDQVEHRGLDPWVQWVSVHTGQPSTVHGVLHLGDTPDKLGLRQLWEVLDLRGTSSGVWGAMNATRGDARLCKFFLPDPWTFSEPAYPADLNDLLALPRYYSKNYLDVSIPTFLRDGLKLARYVLRSGALGRILGQMPFVLGGVARNGINNGVLFSLFDLVSVAMFVARKRDEQPDFSLIFMNSIAHLQHHRWGDGKQRTGEMKFGLRVIDRTLGWLFASLSEGESVVVMNALSQRNIVGERPRVCYRQINPAKFLHSIGVDFSRVEQLMTNDAHVFFASAGDCKRATEVLAAASLEGKPLFHVEADSADPLRLFYQVDFWDELDATATASIGGRKVRYLEHFEAIVARSGSHVQTGKVFAEGIELPEAMYNHEMAGRIEAYFAAGPGGTAHG